MLQAMTIVSHFEGRLRTNTRGSERKDERRMKPPLVAELTIELTIGSERTIVTKGEEKFDKRK